MKSLFIFVAFFLISRSALLSQEPTETHVLVEVIVENVDGEKLPNETVIFTGRKSGDIFKTVTESGGISIILLPKGDIYDISYKDLIFAQDYAQMDVPDDNGLYTYTVNIIYEPSRVFRLNNVYFEFAKSNLKPESFPALDELVELLKLENTMEIEISGHTDNIGSDEFNMKLSQGRAEAVRQYLIRKGISARRVKAVGYGTTQPIADNETEESRQLNRRTEVKILNR